jgi:hypothetical protein
MTFRTVVRDGLIVINTHGEVPDGTPVRIVLPAGNAGAAPARRRTSGSKAGKRGARGRAEKRVGATGGRQRSLPEFGFGLWKHRSDIGDTAEFARELRTRSSTRSTRAGSAGRGRGRAGERRG